MYYRENSNVKRIAPLLLIPPFLLLSFFALRLAYADYLARSGDPAKIAKAVALFPSNPDFQAKAGNLRKSLELNPYQSAGWIELSAQAEAAGNLASAERHLLKANEVDAMFDPRWAIANFYFRQDRKEEFWKWLSLALERSYGDRTALFQLAWRSGESARAIASHLRPSGEALVRYVEFLTRENNLDAAAESALVLLRSGDHSGNAPALALCDRLVREGKSEPAIALWNACLPAKALRPGTILNPTFDWKPLNTAFDWRLPWLPGLEHRWRTHALTIVLTGKQEESSDLLEQYVPVKPAADYTLRSAYRAEGMAKSSGVHWQIYADGRLAEKSNPLTNGDQSIEFRFRAPGTLIRLVLHYDRLPGTSRPEAQIELREVTLTP